MRRSLPILAIVLLAAAAPALVVVGFGALSLERRERAMRDRERGDRLTAEAVARANARALAPTEPARETWEIRARAVPTPLGEEDRLLLAQAEYLERTEERRADALDSLARLASSDRPVAAVAALRAGAIALGLERREEGRTLLEQAAKAAADLADPEGHRVRESALALLALDGVARRDATGVAAFLVESGNGRSLAPDAAPGADDLVVAVAARAAEAGFRDEALEAAARTASRGRRLLGGLSDSGAGVDGRDVLVLRGGRLEARDVSMLLDPALEDPDVRLELVPAGGERARRFEAPLDAWAVEARSRPGSGTSIALGLFAGIGAYALGAVLLILAFVWTARAERQRSDFVASVSHEMKTPIASVRALAELLADGAVADPERARSYAERIGWEMERLGATVRNVLDAARIERGGALPLVRGPVDPARVVQEAVDVHAPDLARRGFRVKADVRSAAAPFWLDGGAVRGVISNLIDNAAKYGGEAREVDVVAGPTDAGGYRMEVRDRGIGVPEEERERLFDRFFRGTAAREGAFPGVGLGLYVARGVVEAHGGTIRVESRDGGGTSFLVDLPPGSAP